MHRASPVYRLVLLGLAIIKITINAFLQEIRARVKIPGTNWKQWRNAFQWVPRTYNHADSLHVYFWHIWVPCIAIRTRNYVNTLIHILYNFQTIWVQCISMCTQNCINTLVQFLYIYYTIWVQARTLTDVVTDVISWLLSLNVNKIE